MSGKWNPVLLSTGRHPRCGLIRWTDRKSILCRLGLNRSIRRDLGRGDGIEASNGGFAAVIPDRWRSAFGRHWTIVILRCYLFAAGVALRAVCPAAVGSLPRARP